MKKLAIIGDGKMGTRIKEMAPEAGLDPVLILGEHNNQNGSGITKENFGKIDVAIDFSHPSAVKTNILRCLQLGIPVVVGTTGWHDDSGWTENLVKEHSGKLLYGSNFSLGVQLFIKLAAQAGKLFGSSDLFHAALNEIHHTEKADAPSGTAITLAKSFLGKNSRYRKTGYGIPEQKKVDPEVFRLTSQRIGGVYGEHSIRINSEWDDIEISHKARNRDGFAAGALKAGLWITDQPSGFYLIEDVVEKILSTT